MNKELISRVRDILFITAQSEKKSITPKAIMDKFECSIEEAFDYIDIIEKFKLGESTSLHLTNENVGYLVLNFAGLLRAEDMRNEKRWNNVLNVCDAIDNYSPSIAFEILNKCISCEIQSEISKQYSAQ